MTIQDIFNVPGLQSSFASAERLDRGCVGIYLLWKCLHCENVIVEKPRSRVRGARASDPALGNSPDETRRHLNPVLPVGAFAPLRLDCDWTGVASTR